MNLINICNKIYDDKKIYYLQTEKLVFPEFIQIIIFLKWLIDNLLLLLTQYAIR